MVTDYPQQLTATAAGNESTGLFSRTMGRLGQMLCGLEDMIPCCTSRATA
jgi:hypothetical protein